MNKIGLYLHTPFCLRKCNYCDFYSLTNKQERFDEYIGALQKKLLFFGEHFSRSADTVYLGGGTPTLLGADRLAKLLQSANDSFRFQANAEITLEANPADSLFQTLKGAKAAGVNRLSLGVQSANETELAVLGRRHTAADVIRTVEDARRVGIDNISLDLMIGIPDQTEETLLESIDFLRSLEPKHISVYMLQLERGTPLYKSRNKLNIPDSDKTAELYMLAVESLEKEGFSQYEVSNFCKTGYFSRHNKKYWCLEEYLGIGPAAHSFMQGKRFHFEADLEKFIKGADVIDDGIGATAEEYIMLSLRLVEGLDINKLKTDYGLEINKRLQDFLTKAQAEGYLLIEDNRIKLKTKGFLMQNPLIAEILDLMNI